MNNQNISHKSDHSYGPSLRQSSSEQTDMSKQPGDSHFNRSSTDLKHCDHSKHDSRLGDSGVWSGLNIHSEEIITPESPVSKSSISSLVSDKFVSDSKNSYMRLDSGIDVSQSFSELSLKDTDSCEKFNDLSSKSKTSSSIAPNISEQVTTVNKETDQLKPLVDKYFEPNEDGDTELHLAIIHKFIEPVFGLVRMVPNPGFLNIKNNDRQTALHLAVLTRQHRLVRLLVVAGVAIDTIDCFGNTALHLAVQANDLTCVNAIIEPVATLEVAALQLRYSPYPFHSFKDVANIHNYDGQTCAHVAAVNGNIEILRYLLWFRADINAKEWKGGRTCLHLAVEQGDVALCMFLLREKSMNAEETNYAGHTAYQLAYDEWNTSIMQALQDHGVDTYISDTSDDEDDEMPDVSKSNFNKGLSINGGGLVNVGA